MKRTNPKREPAGERGSALVIAVLLMLAIASLSIAHLTKVLAEQQKLRMRDAMVRATALADGEIERAKNIVNAAPYAAGQNTALTAAVTASDHFVPGTTVQVERLGPVDGDLFLLTATCRFGGAVRTAQACVSQATPVTGYNLYSNDTVATSGRPRGDIHSNHSIEFWYPDGLFEDAVEAAAGFSFRGGASPANTTFADRHDEAIAPTDLLDKVSISAIGDRTDNTLTVKDDLIAEVEFQGPHTAVKLFEPARTIEVPVTLTRRIFDHYDTVHRTGQNAVYRDETYTETVADYEARSVSGMVDVPEYSTRTVTITENVQVWIESPPPGGAGSGGVEPSGGGGSVGHWETRTVTRDVQETYVSGWHQEMSTWTEWVQTGTHPEVRTRSVFDHWEAVEWDEQVPIYRDEEYAAIETQTVPERYVRTETIPTRGVLYVEKLIRSVKGQVNGQMTIVSNTAATITGSIQYVDDEGDKRMRNGESADMTSEYSLNPDYGGNSVLAIMSTGDLTFSHEVPQNFEINAALVSTQGRVGYEGLVPINDGATVENHIDQSLAPTDKIKESIRRLGGIVSRKRPVSSFIHDQTMQVVAGFKWGKSMMDPNLVLRGGSSVVTPPMVIREEKPLWLLRSVGKRLTMD